MPYVSIIDLSRSSVSIDFDLIKAIINRVIKTTIADAVNKRHFKVSQILWYPSWRWDRVKKKKTLKDIHVKLCGQSKYMRIDPSVLSSTGLHLNELFEYLERSDAVRQRLKP